MSADDIPAPAPITRKVQPIDLAAFPPAQPTLIACMKEVIAALESGELVRDISRDSESGFVMRMVPFVQKMTRWQLAIADAERSGGPVPRCLKECRDLLRDLELSQEWSAEMREAISDAIHNADNALRTLTP